MLRAINSPFDLGETGDSSVLPELIAFLESGATNEKRLAASAIGKIGRRVGFQNITHAIPSLVSVLDEAGPQTRQYSLKTLKSLTPYLDVKSFQRIREISLSDEKQYNRDLASDILSEATNQSVQTPAQRDDRVEGRVSSTARTHRDTASFAIVHFFTTGPNPSKDGIIHIGAIKYTSTKPPGSKAWLCNPQKHITRRQFEISKVSNDDASSQPVWEDQRESFLEYVNDIDHIFIFSLNHLERWIRSTSLLGTMSNKRIIDLYQVAQFLLPDKPLYDERQIIDDLLGEGSSQSAKHRLPVFLNALDRLLQECIKALKSPKSNKSEPDWPAAILAWAVENADDKNPLRCFDDFIHIADGVKWEDNLFANSVSDIRLDEFPILEGKTIAAGLRCLIPKRDVTETEEPDEPDEDSDEPTLLSDQGVADAYRHLLKLNPDFRTRDSQVQYSKFVAEAANNGGVNAIEAGTGTGKTLAYLVPACLYSISNPGRKVVVATATKNLQDQILQEELPKLTSPRNSLFKDIRAALVKGKGNYLCMSALLEAFTSLEPPSTDPSLRMAWLYLYMRLARCGGDLEGIPRDIKTSTPGLSILIQEVEAQSNCSKDSCALGGDCVYPRTIRQALKSDIIVTNQHKLAFLPPELLASCDICIVDEADQFPDNFRSSLENRIASYDINKFLVRLVGSDNRKGFIEILTDRIEKDSQSGNHPQRSKDSKRNISRLATIGRSAQSIKNLSISVTETIQTIGQWPKRWQDIPRKTLDSAIGSIDEINDSLALLSSYFDSIAESSRYDGLETGVPAKNGQKMLAREKRRLESYSGLAEELHATIDSIADGLGSRDYVHTISKLNRGWEISRSVFDISGDLKEGITDQFSSVILTSATLFVGNETAFFQRELFQKEPFDSVTRIDSPFGYSDQCFAAVTASIPRPVTVQDAPGRRRWLEHVSEIIGTLSIAFFGRTLVLFTSSSELDDIANRIEPRLSEYDIQLIRQDGASIAESYAFRQSEHTVLMGVDRFWTGVDFPGTTLSQVIVVRSPNPNLGRPLIRHRGEHQRNFWHEFYHPYAQLRLRQGFGRLIRSETDRGAFIFLDSRVLAGYPHNTVARELPVKLKPYDAHDSAHVKHLCEDALAHTRLKAEFKSRETGLFETDTKKSAAALRGSRDIYTV